jgi:hypothetical protein
LGNAGIGFAGLACLPVPQLAAVREFAWGKRIGRETGISAREARFKPDEGAHRARFGSVVKAVE